MDFIMEVLLFWLFNLLFLYIAVWLISKAWHKGKK